MISIKVFLTQKKYFASAFLYACFSLIFSTWVTYIPYLADKLSITEGKIGGALFFASLGALIIVPVCNLLINRLGVGQYTFYALMVFCLVFFGPFLAFNYSTFCAALFMFGMTGSSFGIAINSLTATIEKQDNVYIMSGSHGFFSAGGMVGAATGSFIAALLHNMILHVALLVVLLVIIQLFLRKQYIYIKGEPTHKDGPKKYNFKPLVLTALIALIIMESEGAIADWSALYLKKIIKLDLKYIGLGFAGFSLAMTIGRFSGDYLSKKFGSWQLIAYCILLSVFGFLMVLIIHPFVPLIGFFIIGLGFSVIVPEVYRIASNTEGIKTSDGISFIAATANIGYLLGPVFLGLLAEMKTLHFSFAILTCFVAMVFILSLWKMRKAGN